MVNYQISDFIARINIARKTRTKTILVTSTKVNLKLLVIFEELGIITGYHILDDKTEVIMKYYQGRSVIINLTVLSKPSRRIYVSLLGLHKFKEKYSSDIMILSTSKGIMLDIECIKKKRSGLLLLRISL